MALLETDDTIKQYYNTVKDKYPDLSYEQFVDICKTPFRFFKIKIESDELPSIHIKYFGKFKVHAASIIRRLKELEKKKSYLLHIDKYSNKSEEKYLEYKANLEKRLQLIKEDEIQRHAKTDSDQTKTSN